jgi:hypothetical protein
MSADISVEEGLKPGPCPGFNAALKRRSSTVVSANLADPYPANSLRFLG